VCSRFIAPLPFIATVQDLLSPIILQSSMSSSILGKRSRNSGSPPVGESSGRPEEAGSVAVGTTAAQSEDGPVDAAGEGSSAKDLDDDDDDEIGPSLDIVEGEDGNANKRRKKRAGMLGQLVCISKSSS
jgi:hypothetical protein